MADQVKHSKQIKLVAGFVDGDDRAITLDNPKDNVTAEEINALEADAVTAIIGDKAGADFKEWKSASVVETKVTTLDLASA